MKGLALLLPVLVALQVGVQPALAWAWPVDGPVLRPFVLGEDPYAGGQHRGVDIAGETGAPVRAPASGAVAFAGTVPSGGKTVTIRTEDGYAVTLLHLGDYSVARGQQVSEGDAVGTVEPSGVAAEPQPYVYLGIRVAADPNGYVDPLGLLPPPATPAQESAPPPPAPQPAPASAGGKHGHASAPDVRPSPSPSTKHASATHPSSAPAPKARAASSRHAGALAARAHRPTHAAGPERIPPEPLVARTPPIGTGVAYRGGAITARARPAGSPRAWAALAAVAAGLGSALALLRRRRQLGHAGTAHGAPAVLLERVPAPAEDAHGLWLGEKNDVVLDGDLERILLAEREALANLDRDHDPAQVVDVADDPRFGRSPRRARRRVSTACSVRPHVSPVSRPRRTLDTSPRVPVSNHHFGRRSRRASFV
jgi:hypothetical protein